MNGTGVVFWALALIALVRGWRVMGESAVVLGPEPRGG